MDLRSQSQKNLGRVVLPETIDARVSRTTFHVSAVRPQMCAISHAGFLTVTFTSPFVETHHIREFARMLTSQDISVTVSAARVTETELTEERQTMKPLCGMRRRNRGDAGTVPTVWCLG